MRLIHLFVLAYRQQYRDKPFSLVSEYDSEIMIGTHGIGLAHVSLKLMNPESHMIGVLLKEPECLSYPILFVMV